MREKDIENKVKNYFKKERIFYLKYHGNALSYSGIPDLLFIYDKIFCCAEIKKHPNKLTLLQQKQLELLKKHSSFVFVLDQFNVDRFLTLLKMNNKKELEDFSFETLKKYGVI